MQPASCHIAKLPPEILLEIVEYVRIHPWDRWGEDRISTQSRSRVHLSRIARVSSLFYEPAMSILWREIHLSPDGPMDRFLLQHLDTTTKNIPRYIRTIHFTVVKYYAQDVDYFQMIPDFVRRCVRLMDEAESLRSVILDFHLLDPRDSGPEHAESIQQTNIFLQGLLQYIEQRALSELELVIWFNPKVESVIDIIKRKITKLVVRDWALTGHWVHRLPELESLRHLEIQDGHNAETVECARIWTAIANLRIANVENTNVPYPLTLNLQFPNLVRISLEVSPPEGNWARTFLTVFERMPNLRSAELTSRMFYWFEKIANSVRIEEVACRDLREVLIYPYSPKRLLSAIARSCPKLTSCNFGGNLDDEDLFQLSQCKELRRLKIRFPGDTVRGFPFLANLSTLTHLTIPSTYGQYLEEHILVRFAKSCPALSTIVVLARRRRYRDPVVPPEVIFPGVASLHDIFEPDEFRQRWNSIERESYKVHLYKLRQRLAQN